jgi:uncharacterized membrane protein YdjX (TVP38/TMEM64 family)
VKSKTRNAVRWVAAMVVIGCMVSAAVLVGQDPLLALGHWLDQNRSIAAVVLVACHVLTSALMLPSWVFIALAGYLFGIPLGLGLAYLSTLTASLAVFAIGRTLGHGWAQQRLQGFAILKALDAAVVSNGLMIVTLTRLSLVLPLNLLNYAYSVTGVGLNHYAIGTAVGLIPAVTVYAVLGASVDNLAGLLTGDYQNPGGWMLWVSLAIALGVTWWVARLTKQTLRQHLTQAQATTDTELATNSQN